MTQDDELILSQSRELFRLRREAEENARVRKAIHGVLYSVGGPLNDNKLKYSKEQLGPFFQISGYLED